MNNILSHVYICYKIYQKTNPETTPEQFIKLWHSYPKTQAEIEKYEEKWLEISKLVND
jgi:hypothetical protein